jgi:hypothetical protein
MEKLKFLIYRICYSQFGFQVFGPNHLFLRLQIRNPWIPNSPAMGKFLLIFELNIYCQFYWREEPFVRHFPKYGIRKLVTFTYYPFPLPAPVMELLKRKSPSRFIRIIIWKPVRRTMASQYTNTPYAYHLPSS